MNKKGVFLAVFYFLLVISLANALPIIYTTDGSGNLKTDFSPEEVVYIRGNGFNQVVNIEVIRPDNIVDKGISLTINGEFVFAYQLDGVKGTYYIYATDGEKSAQTIFTDAAIWTTKNDCGGSNQDVNHYNIGESVYINGNGFSSGNYSWDIKGKPGGASCDPNLAVASGILGVNNSGEFCFNAYTVQNGDCGEYQVKFGVKGDNYRVTGNVCSKNKDCGEKSSSLECQNNNIVNVTTMPKCVGGNCTFDQDAEFVHSCGDPKFEIICIEKNVTKITTTPNCGNGECFNTTTIQTLEVCDFQCLNGECQENPCGNGFLDQGEECDDGNNNNGDGCSSDCKLECSDEDDDNICDEDDKCPDSKENEPVDQDGCDIFQFCEKFSCGEDCFKADWKDNEQEDPKDCTVVIVLQNGIISQPICAPTIFSEMCAG